MRIPVVPLSPGRQATYTYCANSFLHLGLFSVNCHLGRHAQTLYYLLWLLYVRILLNNWGREKRGMKKKKRAWIYHSDKKIGKETNATTMPLPSHTQPEQCNSHPLTAPTHPIQSHNKPSQTRLCPALVAGLPSSFIFFIKLVARVTQLPQLWGLLYLIFFPAHIPPLLQGGDRLLREVSGRNRSHRGWGHISKVNCITGTLSWLTSIATAVL